MSSGPRCWVCSGEIRATDRSKIIGDLSVSVHVGCFDELFEARAPKPSSEGSGPCPSGS